MPLPLCSFLFQTWKNRAGIAQLVERNLAKVEVAGSSPVSRSTFLVIFLQEYYHNF